MVRWLINGRVKDEEYENNAGDVIENKYDIFSMIFSHKNIRGNYKENLVLIRETLSL